MLARMALFRRVGPADLARLVSVAELRAYDRGDRIFQEGDLSDAFVVVATGRVG
jgi:CRP-like cAMP-binding protein